MSLLFLWLLLLSLTSSSFPSCEFCFWRDSSWESASRGHNWISQPTITRKKKADTGIEGSAQRSVPCQTETILLGIWCPHLSSFNRKKRRKEELFSLCQQKKVWGNNPFSFNSADGSRRRLPAGECFWCKTQQLDNNSRYWCRKRLI